MKNLFLIFLAGVFILGCQSEKLESAYQLKEDSILKIGIKELIRTGTTDKLEVTNFSVDEQEDGNELSFRSFEPAKYNLAYAATPDPRTDCCDAVFLGFDEYDLSEPFILVLEE